jgi:glycosyltransferase involved in cell wall biosynthesis
MTRQGVSVVVPVYNNASTLAELARRIRAAVGDRPVEIVMVDDGSSDASWTTIAALDVRRVAHDRNRGQNAAVLTGLRTARLPLSCVLDADLEDPPEAIPALLAPIDAAASHVVFSSRDEARPATSRVFRRLIQRLFPSLPDQPCLCLALDERARARLLAEAGPDDYVPAVIGSLGLAAIQVSVARGARPEGASGYSTARRVRYGLRMAVAALRRARHTGRHRARKTR